MAKQESMTSGGRSDLRAGGMPGDGRPDTAAGGPGPGAAGGISRGLAARAASASGARGRVLAAVAAVLAAATRSRARRLTLITVAAVIAAGVAIAAIAGTSGGGTKHRSTPPAPAFTLPVLGHPGQHISLAGLAGRPVIINFFASWCPPCQKETPLLARFYRASHGSIALIGVDANDKAAAALKFARTAGVSYPVGFDPFPMHTTISYGVGGLPQTFFLDARHRIVKRIIGAVTQRELTAGAALITKQTKRG
jgi:cytochrome c biogenesis protein CcmG, thiol:disulfide interchange protein DsbE